MLKGETKIELEPCDLQKGIKSRRKREAKSEKREKVIGKEKRGEGETKENTGKRQKS